MGNIETETSDFVKAVTLGLFAKRAWGTQPIS
jgi:hypothetical protein